MVDDYDDYDEPYPSRSKAVQMIALLLILALGAAFAGVNLISALRRNEAITPGDALADPRGFRFLSLDPATQTPVRYDPCSPLPYIVIPRPHPPAASKMSTMRSSSPRSQPACSSFTKERPMSRLVEPVRHTNRSATDRGGHRF